MTLGDSKLGTSKLGVPIAPESLPDPAETPRDRADEVVKSAYPTGPGTNWDKFLNTLTEEFEHEYATIRDIEKHRFVDTATGEPLDKIGRFVHLSRRHGEPDEHFRRRIKLQLPKHATSGTLDEILDMSTMILDCEPEQLNLRETFELEPARFDVFIREQVIHDAFVGVDEYVDLLQEIKAGGVRAVATIGKQFTHRSKYEADNDLNDPERAYASRDGSVEGAPYADVITAKHRSWRDFPDDDGPPPEALDGFGEGQFGDGPFGH